MSTLEEIETAIEALPAKDYMKLLKWLDEREYDNWDRQIEADVASGKLDHLAEQALDDRKKGRCFPLP